MAKKILMKLSHASKNYDVIDKVNEIIDFLNQTNLGELGVKIKETMGKMVQTLENLSPKK